MGWGFLFCLGGGVLKAEVEENMGGGKGKSGETSASEKPSRHSCRSLCPAEEGNQKKTYMTVEGATEGQGWLPIAKGPWLGLTGETDRECRRRKKKRLRELAISSTII